jgi:hypothetical protein
MGHRRQRLARHQIARRLSPHPHRKGQGRGVCAGAGVDGAQGPKDQGEAGRWVEPEIRAFVNYFTRLDIGVRPDGPTTQLPCEHDRWLCKKLARLVHRIDFQPAGIGKTRNSS